LAGKSTTSTVTHHRSSASASASSTAASASRARGNPIIIVPAGTTSALTIWNVKQLLEDGEYVSLAEAKAQSGGKRAKSVVVERKVGDKVRKYEVTDQANLLSRADWDRVVAVFALGQVWQFKDWHPAWQNPTEVFAKARGFYLMFDDEAIPASVKNWNVKVLKVCGAEQQQQTAMRE
jgi:parafibromin